MVCYTRYIHFDGWPCIPKRRCIFVPWKINQAWVYGKTCMPSFYYFYILRTLEELFRVFSFISTWEISISMYDDFHRRQTKNLIQNNYENPNQYYIEDGLVIKWLRSLTFNEFKLVMLYYILSYISFWRINICRCIRIVSLKYLKKSLTLFLNSG